MTKRQRVVDTYRERRQQFGRQKETQTELARRISHARLLTFLLGLGGWVSGLAGYVPMPSLAIIFGIIAMFLFVGLVFWHRRVFARRLRYERLERINAEAIDRSHRDWLKIPHTPVPTSSQHHPLSVDLDIFATLPTQASVYRLLPSPHTQEGQTTLQSWLLSPPSPEVVAQRQQIVRELAPQLDWRQELDVRGRGLTTPPPELDGLFAWAKKPPWLSANRPLQLLIRLLSIAPGLLFILAQLQVLPPIWIVAILVNMGFFALFHRRCEQYFSAVSNQDQTMNHFAEMFSHVADIPGKTREIDLLRDQLSGNDCSAHTQIKRLSKLSALADVRFSPLIYIPLQGVCLWSFHVLTKMEKWQKTVGHRVPSWFNTLGEIEALSALGDLAHREPMWTFPEIFAHSPGQEIRARQLGHPLLPAASCVTNDVVIGPAGRFQLITGSNMSGKSTLLRAIGLNIVLAQAGAPVFAAKFQLPPVQLASSFRIRDSLAANVSFFMAELQRLKEIVDTAVSVNRADKRQFVYLLDEILQGTNVTERGIAVRRVVGHLIANGAIGAISTHDLGLANADGLAEKNSPFHFTESYEDRADGPAMVFDYRLKTGIAPTVNALKLLEIVGLN